MGIPCVHTLRAGGHKAPEAHQEHSAELRQGGESLGHFTKLLWKWRWLRLTAMLPPMDMKGKVSSPLEMDQDETVREMRNVM